MTTIIAGGFDVYSKTQEAIGRLRAAGVLEEHLCEFRVNPPGEHDRLAMGGDHHASEGAKSAGAGATAGAAIGAAAGVAVGIAAVPPAGPAAVIARAGGGGLTRPPPGGQEKR